MKTISKKLSLEALKNNAEVVLNKEELVAANGRWCYYRLECSDSYYGPGGSFCNNFDCNDPNFNTYECEMQYGPGSTPLNCCVGNC